MIRKKTLPAQGGCVCRSDVKVPATGGGLRIAGLNDRHERVHPVRVELNGTLVQENVELTGPYFHNGGTATLEDAIRLAPQVVLGPVRRAAP